MMIGSGDSDKELGTWNCFVTSEYHFEALMVV